MKVVLSYPFSVSLLCHHSTNDTVVWGRLFRSVWIRVANKGCSCIDTNLGSPRAQTQWV